MLLGKTGSLFTNLTRFSTDEVNEMADQLKEKVDRVIVVGLGYAFGHDELAGIASSPTEENLYTVEESTDLAGLVATISDEICVTEISNPSDCNRAGCEQECRAEYSGATCLCSRGILNEDGKSCLGKNYSSFAVFNFLLAGCIDADANTIRTPGETWEVEGMFGMTCTCLESGETDCTFGTYDFYNYGGW